MHNIWWEHFSSKQQHARRRVHSSHLLIFVFFFCTASHGTGTLFNQYVNSLNCWTDQSHCQNLRRTHATDWALRWQSACGQLAHFFFFFFSLSVTSREDARGLCWHALQYFVWMFAFPFGTTHMLCGQQTQSLAVPRMFWDTRVAYGARRRHRPYRRRSLSSFLKKKFSRI